MGQGSVLIVDDDESISESLRTILELEGYSVDTTGTGREALEKCSLRSFDLALVNLRLPDIDEPPVTGH